MIDKIDQEILFSYLSLLLGITLSLIYLSLSIWAAISAVFGATKGPLTKHHFVVRFGFVPGVFGSELCLHYVIFMSIISVILWRINLYVYFLARLGLFCTTVSSCFLIKTYFGGFKTATVSKLVMDAFCGVPANQNFQKKKISFSSILSSIRSYQQRLFQVVESFILSFRKQKRDVQQQSSSLPDPNPFSFSFWSKMLTLVPTRLHYPNVQRIRDIPYGEHPLQQTDIYFHNTCPTSRPILIYIHGGGWRENSGTRSNSGLPFIYQMANQKWIVFSIGYRLSPTHKFPTHIQDVKRGINWVRENAIHYGGDIDCMFIVGGSAGGHLATLAALTDGRDFEEFSKGDNFSLDGCDGADTHDVNINMNSLKLVDSREKKNYPPIRACVSMYAVYDFTNRNNTFPVDFPAYLNWKNIMPGTMQVEPELYRMCSPIDQIPSEISTQFFILHGDHDELVPIGESLYFMKKFKETVKNPNITWLEIPGGHHAYDAIYSPRTIFTIHAMYRYLNRVYRSHISDRLQQRKQRQLKERKQFSNLNYNLLTQTAVASVSASTANIAQPSPVLGPIEFDHIGK